MAARVLNSLGRIGLGVAIIGGIANTALYNGMYLYLISLLYTCTILYLNK